MSVAKIERDIKLLETKLNELDATITDPIERNEYKKELEKEIKKLQRTKSQIEQLERQRQEIESLKSEFTFNDEEPFAIKESEANYDDTPEIETTSAEQTPSISSKFNSEIPFPDNSQKPKNTWAIGGIFGFLLLLGTILVINENKSTQIASHSESQISESVEIQSTYLQKESSSLPSDSSENITQDKYLSNSPSYSSSANSNSFSSASNQYRRQTIQNSISEQQAVNLLSNWQNAKREIFAYPFNLQLLERYQTDKKYQDNIGSVNWLRDNNAYYKYGVQSIDSVEEFLASGDRATIDVVITEQRTFYMNNKVINDGNTAFDTCLVRYNLVSENGQWRIEDYNTVKKIKVR